ncbi:MAG: methyltransferase domain-containing protein, partial [Anaerolineaceae bacterium]|nr:methyltransferase domain-containing protein [Anaerolineaceae bacterium]
MVNFENEKRLNDSRQFWDHEAASFDDDPDHGLKDALVRKVWTDLLKAWLPGQPARILDVGCGTGSISVVMAGFGHQVVGIDLSPAMIALARAKAATIGYPIEFHVMDASDPQFPIASFDAVVCRHLLWALPDPGMVLQHWVDLLKPHGRLILIEGYWSTEAGLHVQEILSAL